MEELVRDRKSLDPRIKRISDVVVKLKPETAEETEIQTELEVLGDIWATYVLRVIKDRVGSREERSNSAVINQLAQQQAELIRLMSDRMSVGASTSSAALSAVPAIPLSGLKLLRMNLPVFSGNYLEWQSFIDLFRSMVDQNPSLRDSQKLYFLKTNLSGEAASLISHLKIEDANYAPALEKLKSRYDKPLEIAHKHIARFLNQPSDDDITVCRWIALST
ncbi:uncharacterized protein LOC134206120 [Armigeres subalbatus]|uniref:uncharacterized protein LOC134206120 n=1 Tax=Armigeres subalbatus TaxID=124917 RepID=UPI002ED07994